MPAELQETPKKGLGRFFGRNKGEPKKEKSSKTSEPEKDVQGFLVPKHFRNLSRYRNSPLFRGTSLVMILCIIVGGLQIFKWTIADKNFKLADDAQKFELEESTRLQQQATGLRPIKSKFKELEVLRRQLRIPMAPVLDTIEKTIPDSISINKITWICPPIAASGNLKRRANVQIEVYFPKTVKPSEEKFLSWPNKMKERIAEFGLRIVQSDWGPEKKFEPSKEQAIRSKEAFGKTRTLTINVELGGGL